MSLDQRQQSFIGNLLRLAREAEEGRGEGRSALADLRTGLLIKEPGRMTRVHKYVVDYLPERRYDDRWYYTLAPLFGAFPQHRPGVSVGAAFRPLRGKSDSMEARFVALLNAHPDDLDEHLRHIVRLLESAKPPQPLDWFRLLEDLLQWDRADGDVQMRWAHDFYKINVGHDGPATHTKNIRLSKQEVRS